MKPFLAALLLLSPVAFADEIADHFEALKKAIEAKTAGEVKRLALATSKLARAEASKPQPEDETQLDYWKQRTSYAQQMDVFTEYSLGATAIAPGVPPKEVQDLVETLLDQNSKSTYLEMTVGTYITAVLKNEGTEGQLRAAQRLLVLMPQSEDALLVLAEGLFTQNQMKEAGEYAARLVSTLAAKPRPETIGEADWVKKKEILTGRGQYVAGVSACLAERWSDCNNDLQIARPLLAGQTAVQGPMFYYLAVSNYRLAQTSKNKTQMAEAIAFGKQAASIAGPLQANARTNVGVMERALAGMK